MAQHGDTDNSKPFSISIRVGATSTLPGEGGGPEITWWVKARDGECPTTATLIDLFESLAAGLIRERDEALTPDMPAAPPTAKQLAEKQRAVVAGEIARRTRLEQGLPEMCRESWDQLPPASPAPRLAS